MENVSLHTFVDASRLAYAPISYARYGHVSGQISVALVTSKARVSPIKSVSILRFALMAAVLGLRLAKTVSEKLKILPSQHTLWTDSMDILECKNCSWNYIGETGRCFQTRKKEHQRNLKNYAKGSNVANHAWKNNHSIDFDNACVIDKGDYRVRKTLESWHTAKTFNADNNSKPLPRQYSILL